VEPRGALTGRSPKLAVLIYSGKFSMPRLIVLRSRDDSNVRGTPGCAYGEVTKTHSFDLVWPVFFAFIHSFGGSAPIRVFGRPGGPLMGRSLKPVVLAYSGQFSMVLLTVLGFRGDSNVSGTSGRAYGEVTKTRHFDLFWQVFYATTQGFAVLRLFKLSGNPGVHLRGGHQNS
jgi:hypothetical protein